MRYNFDIKIMNIINFLIDPHYFFVDYIIKKNIVFLFRLLFLYCTSFHIKVEFLIDIDIQILISQRNFCNNK